MDDYIRLHDDPKDALGAVHFCRNYMTPRENIAHTVVVFVAQLLIPIFAMSVLYTLIAYELRRVAKCQLFLHQNERDVQLRDKRNRKAIRLFVTLVMAFYMFVLPSNIFILTYVFGGVQTVTRSIYLLFTFLQMVLMLNSCVNPIIYSNLHTSFRRSTLRLKAFGY